MFVGLHGKHPSSRRVVSRLELPHINEVNNLIVNPRFPLDVFRFSALLLASWHFLVLLYVHGISSLVRFFHKWPYSVPACFWFYCQLRLGNELVCYWNRRSLLRSTKITAHTEKKSRCVYPVVINFPQSHNKMTLLLLLLHICVLLASLSNAHHWSEREGLDRALFFWSPEFVFLVQIILLRHQCQRIHPQSWFLVDVLCELVEVILVDGSCELDFDASSSSEFMGLRFFGFGKSRGFFNSAVFLFPLSVDFPCGPESVTHVTLWFHRC